MVDFERLNRRHYGHKDYTVRKMGVVVEEGNKGHYRVKIPLTFGDGFTGYIDAVGILKMDDKLVRVADVLSIVACIKHWLKNYSLDGVVVCSPKYKKQLQKHFLPDVLAFPCYFKILGDDPYSYAFQSELATVLFAFRPGAEDFVLLSKTAYEGKIPTNKLENIIEEEFATPNHVIIARK
jgi:hypothetical protein